MKWILENKEWLFSGIGVLVLSGIWMFLKDKKIFAFKNKYSSKKTRIDVKNLTEEEIKIIMKFYNKDLNEFVLNSVTIPETPTTYPIISKLINRNVLEFKSDIQKIESYNGFGVIHNINSLSLKKLNKQYRKNKNIWNSYIR